MLQLKKRFFTNAGTIIFMVILSTVCAVILASLASILAKPQEMAKELDRSKQLLIAAKIFTFDGYFLIKDEEGKYIPAKAVGDGLLEPGTKNDIATAAQILEVQKRRLIPLLTNDKGEVKTFEEVGIDEEEYLTKHKKTGYYKQPWKLFYKILPNSDSDEAIGYVFPVNGFGLWDAIYGYIAIEPDAETVIGISWYDQKETPGLGANIAEPEWQSDFPGKLIFQETADGKTDFKTAPIGITVVKGKVNEVLGSSPKAKSAVDGMAGATLTGNGVTAAYKESLDPYRPFLIGLREEWKKENA